MSKQNFGHSIFPATLILLVIGGLLGTAGGGGGTTAFGCIFDPITQLGCQTGQATISSGGNSITVTFPFAFAKTPQSIELTLLGNNLAKVILTVSYTIWGGDRVWLNMPIAQTDLFGTVPECCISIVTPASGNQNNCATGDMVVNVITASNNASAILALQTSLVSPGFWVQTGIQVSIATAGVAQAVASLPLTSGGTNAYMKVVGMNGGGIGDNPEIGTIQIACSTIALPLGTISVHSTIPAPSATSFRIDISNAPASNQIIIWTAIAT